MIHRSIIIAGILLFSLIAQGPLNAQGTMKESDQLDFAQGLLSRGMYDMAISQYQKFIADYPHSPSLQEAYLSLGEGYFLSQNYAKAVDIFNQFKQLFPNSDQLPVSLLRLGQIDIQQQKYDDAIKELTSIVDQKKLKGPTLQSFDYYLGQAYGGKSDTADALNYFRQAAQVEGASDYTAYAYEGMGNIHAQMRQYDQALDDYTKSMQAAKEDPLKGEITYKIAETQFLSGKYADAIKGFGQVIDQSPASDFIQDALANMLLAYFNLGQYDQLLSEYQKNAPKIKDDGSYYAVHFAAVMAYIELKKFDQANMLLDHMLSFPSLKSQERAKIFIKKADILIREDKFKDALALLDAYSSENSDNADETLFLKAQVYFGLGDYDHAFSYYENVYSNFPDSRFSKAALLGEADARQKMGRLKESEALFLKYYNSQEESDLKSESLFDLVMIAVKAQDTTQIIKGGEEYLKKYPNGADYSKVLIILADTYGSNNRVQDAIKLLQGYLASAPAVQQPNSAYFLLGFYQELSGNSEQALDSYAKVDPQKEEGKFYFGALKNIAIIYLTQKKEDQAMDYFDRLISQAGHNDLQIKTYIWVCNEYIKEQKFKDALRIAQEAEKNFPAQDLTAIKYFEAEALRGLGSCDEADKDYNTVISSAKKDQYTGSAHIGYGLCLEKANKPDEAKAEFQKSLDENADDYTITAHARFETANVDASQGNYDEALKYYLLIATIYNDDYYCSESLLRAARILEHLKRKEDALKLYAEILDKYKNSAAALPAKERAGLLK